MKINLSPQRRDADVPEVIVVGSTISINGDSLDLSDIPEDATYPEASDLNQWLIGPIENKDGEYELTILLPHGANPETYQAFPEPIIVTGDGPVILPFNTTVTETREEIEAAVEYPHGAIKHIKTIVRWGQPDEVTFSIEPNPTLENIE